MFSLSVQTLEDSLFSATKGVNYITNDISETSDSGMGFYRVVDD
jgi:hypothetical protein